MIGSAVGRRYGRALFESASRVGDVAAVEADLAAVVELLEREPAFRRFLASPRVTEAEKADLMERHLEGRVRPLTLSLLRLLVDKRRLGELEAIAEAFHELHREAQGIAEATVATAHPMESATADRVRRELERITGKSVTLRHEIDPTLLGGVKVTLGERVIDGSVAFHMKRLRESLLGARVH